MAETNRIYISEYRECAHDANGNPLQCGLEPSIAEQNVDITSSSVQSQALNELTKFISIYADSDCHILIGSNPTAVQTKKKMAGGSSFFCGLSKPGLKVAVIQEEQGE